MSGLLNAPAAEFSAALHAPPGISHDPLLTEQELLRQIEEEWQKGGLTAKDRAATLASTLPQDRFARGVEHFVKPFSSGFKESARALWAHLTGRALD